MSANRGRSEVREDTAEQPLIAKTGHADIKNVCRDLLADHLPANNQLGRLFRKVEAAWIKKLLNRELSICKPLSMRITE